MSPRLTELIGGSWDWEATLKKLDTRSVAGCQLGRSSSGFTLVRKRSKSQSVKNNLDNLLTILGKDQHLAPGYLTPVGTPPNALETVRALRQQFDPRVLPQNPLPGMTNQPGAPNILLTPAWVASLAAGQDAIFLEDVGGRIDASHTPQPAYIFTQ